MIRIIAKLFAVAAVVTVCLPVQPSSAEGIAFVSASGGGSACTQTAPCGSFQAAALALPNDGGRIICITPVAQTVTGFNLANGATLVFDCPSTSWLGNLIISGSGVYKFQHIGFSGLGVSAPISKVTGGGTLIFEDCVIEDVAGTALDIEPTSALTLVMKNSRVSNNTGGVLLKPQAGGSVTATFDGVTIVNNVGGLKIDSTNGTVKVDVANSSISYNTANGLNIIGGSGVGSSIVNLSHDVIAANGIAGIVANGGNAAVFVDTTLLDENMGGATSSVSGGTVATYSNNRIIGSPGAGFTLTAPLK